MDSSNRRGPLPRVLAGPGGPAADVLADLPGADLTTLQLEVARRRAAKLRGPDVLRRYREDRFTTPAPVPFEVARRVEDALLSAAPPEFERVTLSPVTPLGTHSTVAGLAQNRVVPTGRGTEVAADPTNALALEAAVRRTGSSPVRLTTVQRVVRAQLPGSGFSAHFSLFAAVTAGRDRGSLAFEREHLVEHARFLTTAVRTAGARAAGFQVTTLDNRFADVAASVQEALPDVAVSDAPDRAVGRDYYSGLCFAVTADFGSGHEAVGDGGFTPWTARLLGNAKERLLISGIGVDRVASLLNAPS
ncbi:hypothetical protein ATK30_1131 [Amycolatopsis echigonensis]|uniref:ATP phosphoribosyltransferase regulatory subunit n=1 Tax=Amycolatopsis echigonensis TaxID=2576905 RepID=A0A2N3W935_9PSEU|nr:hypothetical protein [Amycolatopsis niigatensis]PKV90385.1 hypothetical protein ATK30_1131 [Amycolatopsis niigatensis]